MASAAQENAGEAENAAATDTPGAAVGGGGRYIADQSRGGADFKRLAGRTTGLDAAGIAGHSTRIGAAHDLVEVGFDVAAMANAGYLLAESYLRACSAGLGRQRSRTTPR